ncbi:hypothetical protein BHM03_00025177 [Ensete ventricosum]|nr:hypothetical protein BHM03_00025177 [Ensete ventricosum]
MYPLISQNSLLMWSTPFVKYARVWELGSTCKVNGACCFSHYTGVCFTNTLEYCYHWRRGAFLDFRFYVQGSI